MKERAKYYQRIFALISDLFAEAGVCGAVLSPGSRSAPIALSFLRNKKIPTYVINDERSAAYFALGMARYHVKPVVVVCTSGTAALNFSPAAAEAFNQRLPMLFLTADRPPEYVDIGENQVIRQHKLFEPNIRKSFQFDVENFNNDTNQLIELFFQAFLASLYPVSGPVHINLPVREPFYSDEVITFEQENFPFALPAQPEFSLDDEHIRKFNSFHHILAVPGMLNFDKSLRKEFECFCYKYHIPVIFDITSNLHGNHYQIRFTEQILQDKSNWQQLKPDLLITFGKYTVSGRIKEFLREVKPYEHWHIDLFGEPLDTYGCLTKTFHAQPLQFFRQMTEKNNFGAKTDNYYRHWKKKESDCENFFRKKLETDSELYLVSLIMDNLPSGCVLHLANSMPVRLANEYGFFYRKKRNEIEVISNRGTSGIDGSVSTAIGYSLQSRKKNFLIIGDQSFIYDSNALWNKNLPENLKIIVINNKGGGIFRRMKGPSAQKELESYFVNYVPVNFFHLASAYNIHYQQYKFEMKNNEPLFKFISLKKGLSIMEIEIS